MKKYLLIFNENNIDKAISLLNENNVYFQKPDKECEITFSYDSKTGKK